MLTQNKLKQLLNYNPATGLFIWLSNNRSIKMGEIAGTVNNRGYVRISIHCKSYRAHHLAFLYMTGKLPLYPEQEVDHINHQRDDNRWLNLRLVNNKENQRNQSISCRNKSGHTGIIWHKRDKKWQSQITVNGKTKYLGLFTHINDAIDARKNAEAEHGFHKNHGVNLNKTSFQANKTII